MAFKRFKKHIHILLLAIYRKEIIINYQMGKVGSSSVAAYLRKNDIFEWHIHRFYETPVHRKKGKNVYLKMIDLFLLRLVLMRCSKVRVISGFREPISRDMSMFFHNIENYYGKAWVRARTTDELIELFNSDFAIGDCVGWFESELNRAFNINVYANDFDYEKGYVEFQESRVAFFIYDVRKLDSLGAALAVFLSVPEYKIIRDNVAKNKSYNKVYIDFQTKFSLGAANLEKIRESNYIRHFYSAEDRLNILCRWAK